jgi:hypothetical protein
MTLVCRLSGKISACFMNLDVDNLKKEELVQLVHDLRIKLENKKQELHKTRLKLSSAKVKVNKLKDIVMHQRNRILELRQ